MIALLWTGLGVLIGAPLWICLGVWFAGPFAAPARLEEGGGGPEQAILRDRLVRRRREGGAS